MNIEGCNMVESPTVNGMFPQQILMKIGYLLMK